MPRTVEFFGFNYHTTRQRRINEEFAKYGRLVTYVWEIEGDVDPNFINPVNYNIYPKGLTFSQSTHKDPMIVNVYYNYFFLLIAKETSPATPFAKG